VDSLPFDLPESPISHKSRFPFVIMATKFLTPSSSNAASTRTGTLKSTATPSAAHTISPTSKTNNEDESDEADSSGISSDEDENEDEDGDAMALSGSHTLAGFEDEQCLAGLLDDDMFANETPQAVAGADTPDDDDTAYAGMDDLSDEGETGEADDDSIWQEAERDLIEEFEETERRRPSNSKIEFLGDMSFSMDETQIARELGLLRPDLDMGGELDFNVNMNDDPFVGLAPDDSLYHAMYDDAERALGLDADAVSGRPRQDSEDSTETKKRVRFLEPEATTMSRSSSMSSSEEQDPNDLFPDLFDARDDPALRRHFGLDVDIDASFHFDLDDAGSCYDFDGDEERLALALDDEASDEDSNFGSYSRSISHFLVTSLANKRQRRRRR
jgi:hypothetical protein